MPKKYKRKTVLVIEDEPEICNFASQVLTLDGYDVLQADTGDKGLQLAQDSCCALVLLDLRLPNRDGWAVLKDMKANPELHSIPIVMFSASAATAQRRRALKMGAADYLTKPVSAASLSKTVTRLLDMNRKR